MTTRSEGHKLPASAPTPIEIQPDSKQEKKRKKKSWQPIANLLNKMGGVWGPKKIGGKRRKISKQDILVSTFDIQPPAA